MLSISLLIVAALVLVWARVVQTLTEHVKVPPPIGQPRAVVWNDRVFTTDRQLKRYLEARGGSYTRWVSNHSAAFAVIRHELLASATGTRVSPRRHPRTKIAHKAASTRTVKPTAAVASHTTAAAPASRTLAQAPTASGSAVSTTTLVVLALAALEMLLLLFALLPVHLAPTPLRRFYVVPERRIGLFAAAMAILFGLLVSLFLG